ncbi:circadian clock KaiB family protein [Pedobacter sp. AW31-3R]|uniref:circadian clock KaiB family protein n=1 Tax=Pedobacter sp. AW31-3R TaxID=3445781 RepID=UPI003FA03EF4
MDMATEDDKNYGTLYKNNEPVYHLRLFVAGTSSLSIRAISNLKSILMEHLEGKYNLEIIDIHQQPLLALSEDITAVPVMIKKSPLPERKLVGDMSDTTKVLRGLGLN